MVYHIENIQIVILVNHKKLDYLFSMWYYFIHKVFCVNKIDCFFNNYPGLEFCMPQSKNEVSSANFYGTRPWRKETYLDRKNEEYQNKDYCFGAYLDINKKSGGQQDVVLWVPLENQQFLSTESLRHRLWTTFLTLDRSIREKFKETEAFKEDNGVQTGSTVTACVCDGRQIITANLGDSAAFALLYNNQNAMIGIKRLNSSIHQMNYEEDRMKRLGFNTNRARGLSRTLGQHYCVIESSYEQFKQLGYIEDNTDIDPNKKIFSAAPQIDIIMRSDLIKSCNLSEDIVHKIYIVSMSDAIHQNCSSTEATSQEKYLQKLLENYVHPEEDMEKELAKKLADAASKDGSKDNLSVIVTRLDKTPFLQVVLDGHGEDCAVEYAADHFVETFNRQCALSDEEYKKEPYSVYAYPELYNQDHPDSKILGNQSKDSRVSIIKNEEDEQNKISSQQENSGSSAVPVEESLNHIILSTHGEECYWNHKNSYGYSHKKGGRHTQEDAMAYHHIPNSDLGELTAEEIGRCLEATYAKLDEQVKEKKTGYGAGTTASTTVVYKDILVTATLADAVAFAAMYDEKNDLLGVQRLNTVIHKPQNPNETERIKALGGWVAGDRVSCGNSLYALNVSRAIGDYDLHVDEKKLITSEPQIDIIGIEDLTNNLEGKSKDVKKILLITTCDGYTEPVCSDEAKVQEAYLKNHLEFFQGQESELAEYLVTKALAQGSEDNVSVLIQSLTLPGLSSDDTIVMGVYDGHGSHLVSNCVAQEMGNIFQQECKQLISSKQWKDSQSIAMSEVQNLKGEKSEEETSEEKKPEEEKSEEENPEGENSLGHMAVRKNNLELYKAHRLNIVQGKEPPLKPQVKSAYCNYFKNSAVPITGIGLTTAGIFIGSMAICGILSTAFFTAGFAIPLLGIALVSITLGLELCSLNALSHIKTPDGDNFLSIK